jgi:hypothetical protein
MAWHIILIRYIISNIILIRYIISNIISNLIEKCWLKREEREQGSERAMTIFVLPIQDCQSAIIFDYCFGCSGMFIIMIACSNGSHKFRIHWINPRDAARTVGDSIQFDSIRLDSIR